MKQCKNCRSFSKIQQPYPCIFAWLSDKVWSAKDCPGYKYNYWNLMRKMHKKIWRVLTEDKPMEHDEFVGWLTVLILSCFLLAVLSNS